MVKRGLALCSLVGLVACGDPVEPAGDAAPLRSIQQLSANAWDSCAVLADGTVRCWGDNGAGELGIGTTGGESVVPLAVPELLGVVQIASGFGFTCAVLSDGTVRCWGLNQVGEIGDGGSTGSGLVKPSPVAVMGLSGVAELSAGGVHACALLLDGTLRCWGSNSEGEAGTGSNSPSIVLPVAAGSGLSGVAQISAGANHTCALLTDGTVRCWGYNASGEVGDGTFDAAKFSPVAVVGLAGVAQISAGFGAGYWEVNRGSHTCAVLTDGTARCWGNNNSGQLGDGTINTVDWGDRDSAVPVVVKDLVGVTQIAAGWKHTCALLEDSTVRCWGSNKYGQLGDGSTAATRLTPVAVAGLSDVAQIVTGETHTCALLRDGTARCWGAGPLGNRTTNYSATPVFVNE